MTVPQPIRSVVGGEPIAEHTPTFTLDRQVAKARREMGEAEWRRLCAEFDAPAVDRTLVSQGAGR